MKGVHVQRELTNRKSISFKNPSALRKKRKSKERCLKITNNYTILKNSFSYALILCIILSNMLRPHMHKGQKTKHLLPNGYQSLVIRLWFFRNFLTVDYVWKKRQREVFFLYMRWFERTAKKSFLSVFGWTRQEDIKGDS